MKKVIIVLLMTLFAFNALKAQTSYALTNTIIIKMVKAKLSDNLIIDVINRSKVNFNVSVDSMIFLSNQNVSSAVIFTMKNAMKKKPNNNELSFNRSGSDTIVNISNHNLPSIPAPGTGNASAAKKLPPTSVPGNHILQQLQEEFSFAYTLPKQNIGTGCFVRINYQFKCNIVCGLGFGLFYKHFKNEGFSAEITNWSFIFPLHIGYQISLNKFRIVPTAGLFWGGVKQKVTGAFDNPTFYAADIGYFGELKVGYAIGNAAIIYLSAAYYNDFNNYSGHFFKATPISAGVLFKI